MTESRPARVEIPSLARLHADRAIGPLPYPAAVDIRWRRRRRPRMAPPATVADGAAGDGRGWRGRRRSRMAPSATPAGSRPGASTRPRSYPSRARLVHPAVEVDEQRHAGVVPQEEHRLGLVLDAVGHREVVGVDKRAEAGLDLVMARCRIHR